jgi:hypothetical protein
MVNVGDRVVVDDIEAVVLERHAAGKHVKFTLSDGRVLNDLDLRNDIKVNPTVVEPLLTEEDIDEVIDRLEEEVVDWEED